ncbi:flagellar motor switch protein FliN [Lapillicoccus jejuensis]|uniref:Flagellar motor switch protein FliN/FliY n=1 Tax=Lapillicoccus jejuensis TaxID=402171 RepID=A0A542E481_9MICO|nr:flagellar motor switch protein FliN [Lapillicoccus jejuensis]TQJ10152.1 flagellar motor switch protein FliN/FliY [Lapillicoccus jejuensis]
MTVTTTDPFATSTEAADDLFRRALGPAVAAAQVLPTPSPLTAGTPQDGSALAGLTAVLPGAAVAMVTGRPGGLAVLVRSDLVSALAAGAPGLDLGAAAQPALDAAAASLGLAAERADAVDTAQLPSVIDGPLVVVPLEGADGVGAAVVVSAYLLARTPGSDGATSSPFTPDATFQPRPGAGGLPGGVNRGLEMLHGVDMELTVELGRTRMTVRELLALAPGDVLELDRAAGSPADLLVNGRLIARGEVVVVDEDFGLRVTEILDGTAG